jgi:DNA polymerase III subunit delta'
MFNAHLLQLAEAHQALSKSQALLITGPLGHGAGLFARTLAKARLCERRTESSNSAIACEQCPSCHWFALGHHPDYRRLSLDNMDELADSEDGAAEAEAAPETISAKKGAKKPTQITLEALRSLGDFFTVGGHRGQGRFVIIEPVEALNVFAANRLLKTLEEPTSGLVFLLVAESTKSILPTIRSRCHVIALPAVPAQEAQEWVAKQLETATSKPQNLNTKQIERLVQEAAGAPLLAAQLADPEQNAIHRLVLDAIAALPDTDLVDTAQALQAAEPKVVFSVLQRWLEDLARVCAGAAPRYFGEHQQRLSLLAKRTQLQKIGIANEALMRERRLVSHPLNWRLFCEQTLAIYVRSYRVDPVIKVLR